MKRVLFTRNYRSRHGGHITVRDFFLHSMAHPKLDPYVYFTPGSRKKNDIWRPVPRDRFVPELRVEDYDVLFVGGTDWALLPPDTGDIELIAIVLHIRHATSPLRRKSLARRAYRIADAQEVRDAIDNLANGPVEVIHEAIDFDLFTNQVPKRPRSVLIFGQKNPTLADALTAALHEDGVDVTSFNSPVPQTEFARAMSRSQVFVGLPNETEGFYRPPVEAMAAGCAVVSSDAVGSRIHLIKDETCLQPGYDDFDGYLRDVRRLLDEDDLRARLVANGAAMAENFSFTRQRMLYHDFVDRHLFGATS